LSPLSWCLCFLGRRIGASWTYFRIWRLSFFGVLRILGEKTLTVSDVYGLASLLVPSRLEGPRNNPVFVFPPFPPMCRIAPIVGDSASLSEELLRSFRGEKPFFPYFSGEEILLPNPKRILLPKVLRRPICASSQSAVSEFYPDSTQRGL